MLRILEIAFAILFGASGLYFGFKGWAAVFKYFVSYQRFVSYQQQGVHEKIQNAKTQATCFSLSAAGFIAAFALGFNLFDLVWVLLLLLLVIVGMVWLHFLIYRWMTLWLEGKQP